MSCQIMAMRSGDLSDNELKSKIDQLCKVLSRIPNIAKPSLRHLVCLIILSLLDLLPPRRFCNNIISEVQSLQPQSYSLPNEIAV